MQDGKVTAHSRTTWGHGHLRCRIIVAKMAIEALNERLDRVKKPVILGLLKIAVVVTIKARLSLYRAKLLRLVWIMRVARLSNNLIQCEVLWLFLTDDLLEALQSRFWHLSLVVLGGKAVSAALEDRSDSRAGVKGRKGPARGIPHIFFANHRIY